MFNSGLREVKLRRMDRTSLLPFGVHRAERKLGAWIYEHQLATSEFQFTKTERVTNVQFLAEAYFTEGPRSVTKPSKRSPSTVCI